jgi:hypothetical protein
MAVIGGLALIALLLDVGQVLRRGTSVDRSRLLRALTLFILTALPFALLFVFKLYREAYLKFLLVCAPTLLILAAHGIDGIVRVAFRGSSVLRRLRAPGALVLALLAAFALAPSLDNLYSDPAFARDDYRGIARMVEQDAQAGDAVLFNAPNQWEVFTYYHHEGAPAIALPYRPDNEAVVEEALRPIAAQYTRLFVLYYGERESDPSGLFERWLALNTFKADEQWIGNIRLAVYATHQPSQVLDVTAAFGDAITLLRARADLSPHNVGDLIPLELRWRGDQPLAQRYKVFVHLGPSDTPPVAQNDAEPASGFQPTTAWQPWEEVTDRRALWIKTGAPPGNYGLYVGMYDSATGRRLPITRDGQSVGDRLWLGDVIVR